MVEKFITDRQTQGMHIGTLRKILVTLGQILSYAVRHKYIDYNPLKEAERPRDNVQRNEVVEKAAGLRRIRFHDLQHSNASLRLENGENIKYI